MDDKQDFSPKDLKKLLSLLEDLVSEIGKMNSDINTGLEDIVSALKLLISY